MADPRDNDAFWPALPLAEWADTCATLHMWTQVVGKIRLALAAPVNHWWHVTLLVTARGLTTSPMPYWQGTLEIAFDFIDHRLLLETSDGRRRSVALEPKSVAVFYSQVMQALGELEMPVRIWPMPVEVPSPIRFDQDLQHHSYDAVWVQRWWQALVQVDALFKEFRGRFLGKCSPVHFFWGSFDLAVTRFSGRRAPERPGADLDDARSVLARGDQRRFLARQRQHPGSGVLRVRRARAVRVQDRPRRSARGLLQHRFQRVRPQVRRRADGAVAT